MSDTKKQPRAIGEIQQEYQGLCAKAGHLQYNIDVLSRELKMLNDTLRDLNIEGSAAQTAAAVAAKAAEEVTEAKANV